MGLFDWLRGKPKTTAVVEDDEPVVPEFTDIEVEDVDAIVAGGAKVIDVRTPLEFAGGHIAGAVNIPVDKIRANPTEYLTDDNVIFVCEAGGRSAMAAYLARQHDRDQIFNLNGGMGSWREAGMPVVE